MVAIAGIDASITGTAVVRFDLDDDYNFISSKHLSFSSVKKHEELPGVVWCKREMFKNDYERFKFVRETVLAFLHGCDYVAIEGYAMGAKGLVFNIAEFGGILKMGLFESGKKMQVYTPSSVKVFAGGEGKGAANKLEMKQFYDKYSHDGKPDLIGFPVVKSSKGVTPTSDIVDAFYMCDMLWCELLLRNKLVDIDDLYDSEKLVFTVSKKYPEDILGREFIKELQI